MPPKPYLLIAIAALVVACGSERGAPTTSQVANQSTGSSSGAGAGTPGAPGTAEALAELQANHGWGSDQCAAPSGSVGYGVGDVLGDLVFKDCGGAAFDLRELCGAEAVWISLGHAWCPHCQATAEQMEAVLSEYRDAGREVAGVDVLVQDHDFDTPNGLVCENWRTSFAQHYALTVYDDVEAYALILDSNETALNVVIDADRVITAKVHTDVQDTIRGMIDGALP